MLLRLCFLICFLTTHVNVSAALPFSKGKQQQFFPKALKKKGVYLGMPLTKFEKKITSAQPARPSEFNISFIETLTTGDITSYTYLFTKSDTPQLYAIEVKYDQVDDVRGKAVALLGKPQTNDEWRIPSEQIKETFVMGAWTFGHKLVYGATLKGSEWEEGFQSR